MPKAAESQSQGAQERAADQNVSLDSWGLTTPESIKTCRERSKKWRPHLLRMARHVHETMILYKPDPERDLRPKWFMMDGSLLGAYRSGKMIEHDYDFDFGLCFLIKDSCEVANLEQCRKEIPKLFRYLTKTLDTLYTTVLTSDYSYKLEVYQESSGIHFNRKGLWDHIPWYNVHMDMQIYYSTDQKKFKIAYFKDDFSDFFDIGISSFFPLSQIDFESLTWPCPKDPKAVLTAIYGYLGTPAKYNPKTRKYEPLELQEA